MQRGAERGHAAQMGIGAQPARQIGQFPGRARDFATGQRGMGDQIKGRALRQQTAIADVGQGVAAFGFIHVVGRDQHRQAARRQFVQLVPEQPARLRVDAGRRLVQQQQLRVVQQAGGQRQALLPAARQGPGQLLAPAAQAQLFQRGVDLRAPPRHVVDAGDEVEVFFDAQVFVQAEFLRHVADLALDLARLAADVEAQASAAALVGREQAAQHADRGGLAAAVGAQKAVDLALAHLQVDPVDDGARPVALAQAAHVDDDFAIGVIHHFASRISSGWPGCSLAASAGAGRASTMKTSVARFSLL